MGFLTQEYWSGLPFSSPGDFPNLGIKPVFPALQVDSLPLVLQQDKLREKGERSSQSFGPLGFLISQKKILPENIHTLTSKTMDRNSGIILQKD